MRSPYRAGTYEDRWPPSTPYPRLLQGERLRPPTIPLLKPAGISTPSTLDWPDQPTTPRILLEKDRLLGAGRFV